MKIISHLQKRITLNLSRFKRSSPDLYFYFTEKAIILSLNSFLYTCLGVLVKTVLYHHWYISLQATFMALEIITYQLLLIVSNKQKHLLKRFIMLLTWMEK